MTDTPHPLQKVATGLRLIYLSNYSLCLPVAALTLIGVAWMLQDPFYIAIASALAAFAFAILKPLLNGIGRFLCHAYTPRTGGARWIVLLGALLDLLNLLVGIGFFVYNLPGAIRAFGLWTGLLHAGVD